MVKISIAVLVLISSCGQGAFEIASTNMSPTYEPGDKIIILKTGFKKGDVVSYKQEYFKNIQYVVSRVIAVSGDTLEILNGNVYVNRKAEKFKYTIHHSHSVET